MSNTLNNRVDLKSLTFQCFNSVIDVLKTNESNILVGNSNVSLVILTHLGMIQGDFISNFDISDDSQDNNEIKLVKTLSGKVFEMRDKELLEFQSENSNFKLINDSGTIALSDVTITPYNSINNAIHLGFLSLFTDQIIGFSFGEFSN